MKQRRDVACHALVPCAGVGERAASAGPKQYTSVAGRSVVAHTLDALARVPRLVRTLVVLAPEDTQFEAAAPGFAGIVERIGGATRAASVRAGLAALERHGALADDWVLVHDAARCLVAPAAIERLIDACIGDAVGGLLALPLGDTLKQADGERCTATLDRRGKWLAQTPQMFRLGTLSQALAAAGDAVTDDASAIEALGLAPLLVPGEADNFKLTWPEDFARAERVLVSRGGIAMNSFRIGEGWDVHALVGGRPLVLGGVTVPHDKGLAGHSDADALAHAITDALLGAAGLGDIGRHFPDTDPAFEGADSMRLLAEAARLVHEAGYAIGNVDSTVVAQAPRLAPHIPAMRSRLASVLGLAPEQINVKAKTAERMGPVGEGRAIEARATCLLLSRR
jgi:2-C-methyl-D-erythritol 4-phosphate cytidylyltransferase / 2-C-methyl-D-erythritol 2,4-cyclodiphosphate synthase